MSDEARQAVIVVVKHADKPAETEIHQTVRLPENASVADLLRAIEHESPEIYAEIRSRILRAAGGVLAYGSSDGLFDGMMAFLCRSAALWRIFLRILNLKRILSYR